MNKIIIIFLGFLVLSCSDNTVEKPEKLIDATTMENILYDLAMLQAIKGHSPKKLPENSINPKTYIFQKYKIDSAQFSQSNRYYSSDVVGYRKMYENVIAKITQEKKLADIKVKKELKAKQKKIKDSIVKSSKNKKTAVIAKG
ncbi:MAG: DUF4296 domain-containing protein [Bacteroidota bacterium]